MWYLQDGLCCKYKFSYSLGELFICMSYTKMNVGSILIDAHL